MWLFQVIPEIVFRTLFPTILWVSRSIKIKKYYLQPCHIHTVVCTKHTKDTFVKKGFKHGTYIYCNVDVDIWIFFSLYFVITASYCASFHGSQREASPEYIKNYKKMEYKPLENLNKCRVSLNICCFLFFMKFSP